MTLASLLCAACLAGAMLFVLYYFAVTRPRKNTLDWVALQDRKPFAFAEKRHPIERADALPILVITALYALSAFFSLGSVAAPQDYVDFSPGQTVTVELVGDGVIAHRLWSYGTLGTGSYNVEVSGDGVSWSTLWIRNDKDQWGRDTKVYYWANAADYAPSYALAQGYNDIFKWRETKLDNPITIRYIRISGKVDSGQQTLRLNKLVLLDRNGKKAEFQVRMADGSEPTAAVSALFTADDTVPQAISWMNSAYFDEIYHPRTALEHIEGLNPFEWTHPPLGKLIIGLGIRLFGMTPFGWRFMGTLFGVLMVPLVYLLIKHLFGKRPVAVCGTVLFAAEFMHLTQTRIATIDTYGVFFILLSYLFFYRWLTAPATPDAKGRTGEGWLDLALSGIAFGVGVACKWTVLYAGAGLAVLYLIHFILRLARWDKTPGTPGPGAWAVKTLALSVLCFVLIPLAVYTASYYPYAVAYGVTDLSLGNTLAGFGKNLPVLMGKVLKQPDAGAFDAGSLSGIMLKNQWDMFRYHQGVHSAHPYASSWFQWIVDGRPILYYSESLAGGTMTQRFASFNNPLVSWAGLLAVLTCIARCFRRLWAKLTALVGLGVGCAFLCWKVGQVESGPFDPALETEVISLGGGWTVPTLTGRCILLACCLALYLWVAVLIALGTRERYSGKDAFIAVGFLAQFLPWVLVNRITFAYHYFPSVLFLVLAVSALFDQLAEAPRAKWKGAVYGFTAAAAGLYLIFYPALTGLAMPTWYADNILSFLPSWPI